MSINITIGLDDNDVSVDTLDRHMAALGFARAGASAPALAAASSTVAAEAPAEPGRRTRKPKDDAKPAISTNPEDRKPPEDDEATQAQDAADEKAEVEAERKDETPLTVDDVRAAVGRYCAKVSEFSTAEDKKAAGIVLAQKYGPGVFEGALGKPPAGETAWKMSLLASVDQPALRKAVAAWDAATDALNADVVKKG